MSWALNPVRLSYILYTEMVNEKPIYSLYSGGFHGNLLLNRHLFVSFTDEMRQIKLEKDLYHAADLVRGSSFRQAMMFS